MIFPRTRVDHGHGANESGDEIKAQLYLRFFLIAISKLDVLHPQLIQRVFG